MFFPPHCSHHTPPHFLFGPNDRFRPQHTQLHTPISTHDSLPPFPTNLSRTKGREEKKKKEKKRRPSPPPSHPCVVCRYTHSPNALGWPPSHSNKSTHIIIIIHRANRHHTHTLIHSPNCPHCHLTHTLLHPPNCPHCHPTHHPPLSAQESSLR